MIRQYQEAVLPDLLALLSVVWASLSGWEGFPLRWLQHFQVSIIIAPSPVEDCILPQYLQKNSWNWL